MTTFFSDIIPRFQQFSQKLDNLSLLTNKPWVIINGDKNIKIVYIFRSNNELLIAENGTVEKAKWEYLGYNTLLIDRLEGSYLFKQGFFDENVLALKIDSKNEYAFFINELEFEKEINTVPGIINLLDKVYLSLDKKTIGIEDKKNLKYSAPGYKIIGEFDLYTFLGSKTLKIDLLFDDNTKGSIFFILKSNEYYFSAKPDFFMANVKYFYQDRISCINGLHYFIMFNTKLDIGFEKML